MDHTSDIDQTKNFYCSQKFWWLSVDLEKSRTMSCCVATPEKINVDYIRQHPGSLFNSPKMMAERQQMISNQSVASCASTCWIPESKSQISRRISMKSYSPTHTTISASPEILHIIVGSDCNMTCVYCCKYYSSSWAQDIYTHGNYRVKNDDRYSLNDRDRVLLHISQKELKNSEFNGILLNEISCLTQSSDLKEIVITGGEPFLHLGLEQLVSNLSAVQIPIKIYTGLGVNPKRFQKEIDKISKFQKVQLVISAESTGRLYELIRNGNTWAQFEENFNIVKQHNIHYNFYATVSNLTLLGIDDFIEWVKDIEKIGWNPCNDPDFFSVNVIDDKTKSKYLDKIYQYPEQLQEILKTISNTFSPDQQIRLNDFLKEFAQRRNFDLSFLPNYFLEWLTTP